MNERVKAKMLADQYLASQRPRWKPTPTGTDRDTVRTGYATGRR